MHEDYIEYYYQEQELNDELEEKVNKLQKKHGINYTDLGISPGAFVNYMQAFNEVYSKWGMPDLRSHHSYQLIYTQHQIIKYLSKELSELKQNKKGRR